VAQDDGDVLRQFQIADDFLQATTVLALVILRDTPPPRAECGMRSQ